MLPALAPADQDGHAVHREHPELLDGDSGTPYPLPAPAARTVHEHPAQIR
ncbi:hypothetical protein ACRAWF_06670 [Streptomyces sp. L7]